jgi:hypothetical protein
MRVPHGHTKRLSRERRLGEEWVEDTANVMSSPGQPLMPRSLWGSWEVWPGSDTQVRLAPCPVQALPVPASRAAHYPRVPGAH